MRQPRNSLNKDTAEKPYNSENYDIMRKTTTNKQIEDIGGVTRHSEFEKPYKLNWNEDYGNMQNLHPSNYDFSFLDTSSPNFENNIPNIPSGGIGGIDPCKEILQKCGQNGAFNKYCGEAIAMGCLKVIGDCMFYNWNGGISYSDAECFCEKCGGGNCNQQYSENCVTGACEKENCPAFTLEGSDTAPTTLTVPDDICIVSVTGAIRNGDSNSFYVPDEGCGTKQVCVIDMCGTVQCKDVKMSSGTWFTLYIYDPPYYYSGGQYFCNIGSQGYELYGSASNVCAEYSNALQYMMSIFNLKAEVSGVYPPCEYINCDPHILYRIVVSRWICP